MRCRSAQGSGFCSFTRSTSRRRRTREWTFFGDSVRIPEFTAPKLGTRPNVVTIDAVIPADANGVLYKLGGFAGGLTCFVENGILCYEYNLFEIQRTKIRAQEALPAGEAKIEIETNLVDPNQPPRGPLNVAMKVNGDLVAQGTVPDQLPDRVQRDRVPRHRYLAWVGGLARLLRQEAVQVQRHDRAGPRGVQGW